MSAKKFATVAQTQTLMRDCPCRQHRCERACFPGWSTRLGCCLRPLAADTRCACVREWGADLKTHNFGSPVCLHMCCEVFPAGRLKQHASRVLHPGVAVRARRVKLGRLIGGCRAVRRNSVRLHCIRDRLPFRQAQGPEPAEEEAYPTFPRAASSIAIHGPT